MNKLTPELDRQMRSIDYTNFLPMGRSRRIMQLTPESIRQGARAFEAEVAARAMRERQALVQEAVRRRALAAKQLAEQQFRKVWPEGRSEELITNFINKKPFLRYKK